MKKIVTRVFSIPLAVMVLGLGTSAQVTVFEPNITRDTPAVKVEEAYEAGTFTLKESELADLSGQHVESPYKITFSAPAAKFSVKLDITENSPTASVPRRKVTQNHVDNKFNWKPALIQSGILLAIQHGFRMTEKKTRDEIGGPFFRDWKESVQNLERWDDSGRDFTNYVAHPMQGAVSSRIFINNSGTAKRQEFGKQGDYWEGRVKAMAWSALFSLQFEIGPLSEASLGNVGQKRTTEGRSKLTYVDIVVTPVVGTGVVVLEDIFDKYVLGHWLEPKMSNRILMKITRSFLTPSISFANLLRGRVPWTRDNR